MDQVNNIQVNQTQSIGFFSRLQQQNQTPITTRGPPPMNPPITTRGPPPMNSPVETAPVETAPVETAPVETAPVETAPMETAPVETAPVETAPETAPVETAPETAPVETAPVETALVETAPVETAPVETAPVETAPVETAPVENVPVDSIEFINKLNSTPRPIGNNKFQQRIEELESLVEKHKVTEKEYETKINLFKKTIATLQTQLQEKSSHISRLETSHIDPEYEKQIIDLNQRMSEMNTHTEFTREENASLKRECEFLQLSINDIKTDRDNILTGAADLKQRYTVLETTHQRQAVQLQAYSETINRLENKIGLEQNLRTNLENELASMKEELTRYRTDIENITIAKDMEIERLTQELLSSNDNENTLNDNENTPKPAPSVTYLAGNVKRHRPVDNVTRRRGPVITRK
jgi:ribosomal protein L29